MVRSCDKYLLKSCDVLCTSLDSEVSMMSPDPWNLQPCRETGSTEIIISMICCYNLRQPSKERDTDILGLIRKEVTCVDI